MAAHGKRARGLHPTCPSCRPSCTRPTNKSETGRSSCIRILQGSFFSFFLQLSYMEWFSEMAKNAQNGLKPQKKTDASTSFLHLRHSSIPWFKRPIDLSPTPWGHVSDEHGSEGLQHRLRAVERSLLSQGSRKQRSSWSNQ